MSTIQLMHIHAILKAGLVSEDSSQIINELGGSIFAEYPDVYQTILAPLLEQNILQEQSIDGKRFVKVQPIVAGTIGDHSELNRPSQSVLSELVSMLDACVNASEPKEKGESLETFAVRFFKEISGFVIPEDGVRLRTETEELDVFVEIKDERFYTKYCDVFICECKNWKKNVDGTSLSVLRDKLENRNCKFGVFMSLSGVTPGFREKVGQYLSRGLVIALLTMDELNRLRDGVSPREILLEAYNETRKYRGQ